ncbi:hypothetical protein BTO06_01815 [Tenacibaculum sp. SZ-18]|uniref:hypothetical protein n=1 Tax=Tenacibaculum sp. SZ-18 TaxID=754423 RepID=UPI000C2D061C|nr:hypothetical protein [Tenacibaculum sp. SZ-18]AUC13966.1 hypothetical protein BTO06_01815 [Tenacibaculum sp. SZ-18]
MREEKLLDSLFYIDKKPILEILSKLSPTETELLVNFKKVELKTLLKLTFCNLLFNKVLVLKKRYLRSSRKSPLRECLVVETGDRFFDYNINGYESIFVSQIDDESYYNLIPYLKSVYRSAFSKNNYLKIVLKEKTLSDFFELNLLRNFFNYQTLNYRGKELKTEVTEYLEELNSSLPYLLDNHPKKAANIVKKIKGNIFLLTDVDSEFYKRFKDNYLEGLEKEESSLLLDFFLDSTFEILFESLASIEELFDFKYLDTPGVYDSGMDFGDFDF